MQEENKKIIFPLDFSDEKDIIKYVKLLSGEVGVFKIGLQAFYAGGPGLIRSVSKIIEGTESRIFLDVKLYDIPATVQGALWSLRELPFLYITYVVRPQSDNQLDNVYSSKNNDNMRLLGVGSLTSDDSGSGMHIKDLASLAKRQGAYGIICPFDGLVEVKERYGDDLLLITPGIRPEWSADKHDQKRVTTPYEAIKRGANAIVIGRPIRYAQDPVEAVQLTALEIKQGMDEIQTIKE